MTLFDTVAAVSTPAGKGGVAMIRISGADAVSVAERIFKPKSGAPLSGSEHAKMRYGEIVSPADGASIDDGMAVIFRAPHSFTGEDTAEIYCHGGVLVTREVLAAALLAGARLAEAGEFTRRAFVSGRIGLDEAESLGRLLDAASDSQMKLARGGMRGNLTARAREIYSSLCEVMSSVFAAIDFPDEDLAELSREGMLELVRRARESIDALAATYSTGRAVSEGVPTVICGKPNVGKSSVYNRIVGYDAAIVTSVKGTTRDVLRAEATLGKAMLALCDTAGIRQTEDEVESVGIDRAIGEIGEAGLILAVFDASSELDEDDLMIMESLARTDAPRIALLNKSELEPNEAAVERITQSFERTVRVCAKTGEGFDRLASLVDDTFVDGSIDLCNDAVVTGERQYASLVSASESLRSAESELAAGVPLDLCCVGIEAAMEAVGAIDGRAVSEDVVAEIFSRFCVGK